MQWFVHQDDIIHGPLTSEQVLSQLKSGELSYNSYIWGRGQVEWNPISSWEDQLQTHIEDFEVGKKKWKLRESHNLILVDLTFEEVLFYLKKLKDLKSASICPQNEYLWKPVYSSYVFMEALGLSRRSCLRAPLMGLAKISRGKKSRFSYVVKTSTVGPGGIGVCGLGSNFTAGLPVEMRIESQDLGSPILVHGVIKYHTPQGFVGIAFKKLEDEVKNQIEDYVKRFEIQETSVKIKAS